jgi:beta-glucosidase
VIEVLTLDEKLTLLTGVGFSLGSPLEGAAPFIPGVAGYTKALPEHDLPSLLLADGPAGLRFGRDDTGRPVRRATAFPIATALASTWDQELAEEFGSALGKEARSHGIGVVLAPGMNIQRDPLGGRNYEYLSEDPLVSGVMAASIVRGIESEGVGATLKHFVANNQETNRTALDTIIDDNTLRSIYLRGFRIAVEEGRPSAIMTAYNLVNGTHTSQSEFLITDTLRGEWGFDGIVMTDWFAGDDPVAQVASGHSLLMPGSPGERDAISEAILTGELSDDQIDSAITPVVRQILRQRDAEPAEVDWDQHANLARRIAADGMVLLKNGNVLPLGDEVSRISLFGVGGYNTIIGGTGSGDVAEWTSTSIAEGLEAAGFILHEDIAAPTREAITAFTEQTPPPQSIFDPVPYPDEIMFDPKTLALSAQTSDVAIFVLSRTTGEFRDRAVERDFELTAVERELLFAVSRAFAAESKDTVVILNVGGPVETDSWIENAAAVLVAWLPGQEAGHAVADVLKGSVNPSGRLTATWPRSYKDTSTAAHFPGARTGAGAVPAYGGFAQAEPSEVSYEEGLLVGYRFFDQADVSPAFPLGYGISFTSFKLVDFRIRTDDEEVGLMARIRNTGPVSGRTPVMAFVRPGSSAHRELVGFAKSEVLAPGEQADVTISLPPERFADAVVPVEQEAFEANLSFEATTDGYTIMTSRKLP